MGDKIEIQKILNDHEKRIAILESALFSKGAKTSTKTKKSLSDYILDFKNKTFFSQPKTAEEVYDKIQSTYACEFNRVAVALLRLAERKQLRKTSKIINGKKYKAYVW